jgi:hypothetical protein
VTCIAGSIACRFYVDVRSDDSPSWPGFVPAIHVFHPHLGGIEKQEVDARDKRRHDKL